MEHNAARGGGQSTLGPRSAAFRRGNPRRFPFLHPLGPGVDGADHGETHPPAGLLEGADVGPRVPAAGAHQVAVLTFLDPAGLSIVGLTDGAHGRSPRASELSQLGRTLIEWLHRRQCYRVIPASAASAAAIALARAMRP